MKARIVRIGNSQGIRIPKSILAQVDLGDEVDLEVEADRLVIRSAQRPRAGWEEGFERMAARGDDRLLDLGPPSAWDEAEWDW